MTALTQSTKRKLLLLQLAEELGNVSKACKIMGYHRDTSRVRKCRVALVRETGCRLTASAPRLLWSWAMTYLPAAVLGQWFYLYLILDVFSLKNVGFEVHDRDDSLHAAHLLKRTALAGGVHALADKPVLHGDNGATLKATTVLAMLHWLGIKPSYSTPARQ